MREDRKKREALREKERKREEKEEQAKLKREVSSIVVCYIWCHGCDHRRRKRD